VAIKAQRLCQFCDGTQGLLAQLTHDGDSAAAPLVFPTLCASGIGWRARHQSERIADFQVPVTVPGENNE
jgi:hypothetical protein